MKNYGFDKRITLEVLENYLSRAVTAAGLYESMTLDDDLRVIGRLGIKFLGRASGVWYMTTDDEEHFRLSKELSRRVHEVDSEIILQACIFEKIVKRIEETTVPPHVFEAFGIPVEKRNFRLQDTLFQGKPDDYISRRDDPAKDGGVPDISRIETRLWFYYRACRYIDCGYEALHMGQIHLYTANDKGFRKTKELFEKIRAYAREHARRHLVLLDAHTHGIKIDGKLLFDYHAMPFTRAALMEEKGKQLVLVREGYSEGGENPSGWSADAMPYLMEYDNWGGLSVENREVYTREELAKKDWWGYDQIAYFAHLSEEERNDFLTYTYLWTEINNPHAFFELPFRRTLGDAVMVMKNAQTGHREVQEFYQINDNSNQCPLGFSQESAAEKIWSMEHTMREKAANPEHLIRYGAADEVDPETGVKLPEKVVLYGSFQPYVGAVENDSNSEVTRMYYLGDGIYSLSFVMPYKGTFDYSVSTYGTLSATYQADGYPRSGSSNKAVLKITDKNTIVKITYNFYNNEVTVYSI